MHKKHGGKVIDAKGDNLLAKFTSVVDAIECAVKVQNRLTDMNTSLPDHRRMAFRIGVNLGDVIEEGGTIYGDGVNIAARLESLAGNLEEAKAAAADLLKWYPDFALDRVAEMMTFKNPDDVNMVLKAFRRAGLS